MAESVGFLLSFTVLYGKETFTRDGWTEAEFNENHLYFPDFSGTMRGGRKPQLMAWWILWAAIQGAVFMYYYYLGGPATSVSPAADSSVWLAALAPLVLSVIFRWAILPRIGSARPALALFIVGLALAETCCFLGLFIFPAHKQTLFMASVVGVFQFLPYFAGRYYPG